MWLLRRKTAVSETSGEVLPAATGPMRRIEITVERHWVTRLVRGDGAEPIEGEGSAPDPEFRLPRPPDG
jgi:hypothetical protein